MMMMGNSSLEAHFTLGAYAQLGPWRWLCFMLLLCLYALIAVSNLLLIAVITVRRVLHQPMFLLLCSLFVNELLGSSALFPFLLYQTLQEEHLVPYRLCFLQIFCIYLYACVDIFTLAAMSWDRYLAICHPLQYHTLMTGKTVALLLTLSWLVPAAAILVLVWLSASLRLCGHVIPLVYCGNYAIVKLACSSTRLNNIYGLLYAALSIICPLVFILYTYARIFAVCLRGSRHTRHKALSTCTPHLASVINFSFGCCSQVLMSRFDVSELPTELRVTLSLYFFTCQPLFNPLIYGLQMTQVRQHCKELLRLIKL